MALVFNNKSDLDNKGDLVNKLFKGLSSKELIEIYNTAKIKKYNPGEILFQEMDKRDGSHKAPLHFILDGSVRVQNRLNGKEEEIEVLHKGDCLGCVTCNKDLTSKVSVIALEPTTILLMEELGMNMLSPKIQLNLYKNLNEIASERRISLQVLVFCK